LSVPSTVANRYRILEPWDPARPLRVVRAADAERGAEVALLFFPRNGQGLPGPVWEEIRTRCEKLRRNPHPLFLNVLDSGQEDDGFFLVQERPRGETLLSRIRQARGTGAGPFAAGEALGACWLLCRAVESLWPVCCHGFLNPQEVFLEPWDGGPLPWYPKVAHAGVRASLRFSSLAFCGLDQEACLYAAPEFVGRAPLTEATDVYGIGALLYGMLTLRPPTGCFVRPSHRHPGFPGALEGALLRALEEDPRSRQASPLGFSRTLKESSAREVSWEELEAAEVRLGLAGAWRKTGALVLVGRSPGKEPPAPVAAESGGRGPALGLPALLLALLGLAMLLLGLGEAVLPGPEGRGRFEAFQHWERRFEQEATEAGRGAIGAWADDRWHTGREGRHP